MKRFSFSRIGWILLVCLTLSVSASAYEGTYVFDAADILSYDEAEALDNQAASIAENYNFPVYLVIVDNFEEYGFDDVYDCAVSLYEEWQLGFGSNHDGELLFMSMNDRQRATVYTGYGETAFTESGRDRLDADMLSYFRNDDWAGGFRAYMDWSEYLLAEAATGAPYGWEESGAYHPDDGDDYGGSRSGYDDGPGLYQIALTIGIPALVSILICAAFAAQLKSVRAASQAREYAVKNSLRIRRESDRFTHTTETRVKIESESKSGGGGTHHHSGGGHSGRSSGF